RVLNVLVHIDIPALALEIIDYLIDAGHRTYVLGSGTDQAGAWGQRLKYGVSVIDADAVTRHPIDVEIGIRGDRSAFGVGTLAIEPEQKDVYVWSARLIREDGHALLCRQTLPVRRGLTPSDLSTAAKDICIDAITLLAREHQPDALAPLAPTVNHMAELAAWDQALHLLAREAQESISCEDFFSLRDSLGHGCAPARPVLDGPLPRELSPAELELLGLCIQTVLNGRRDGFYEHELHHGQARIR